MSNPLKSVINHVTFEELFEKARHFGKIKNTPKMRGAFLLLHIASELQRTRLGEKKPAIDFYFSKYKDSSLQYLLDIVTNDECDFFESREVSNHSFNDERFFEPVASSPDWFICLMWNFSAFFTSNAIQNRSAYSLDSKGQVIEVLDPLTKRVYEAPNAIIGEPLTYAEYLELIAPIGFDLINAYSITMPKTQLGKPTPRPIYKLIDRNEMLELCANKENIFSSPQYRSKHKAELKEMGFPFLPNGTEYMRYMRTHVKYALNTKMYGSFEISMDDVLSLLVPV